MQANNLARVIEVGADTLFIGLYLLDSLGIYALFIPYLRTFFRLRTWPIDNCSIPARLPQGKKIKLRNSTIYWDAETSAIWLRPRGLNFFTMPFTVVRLTTGAFGKLITRIEILCSPSFPFIIVLFILTKVSATMQPRDRVAFTAIMVASFFLYIRSVGPRIARLIDDAVSEFRWL
jgi:hypothetical protein